MMWTAFLKAISRRIHYRLKEARIDERFKSEDGKTDRFKATLSFFGPVARSAISGARGPQYDAVMGNGRQQVVAGTSTQHWLHSNYRVCLPHTAARRDRTTFLGDSGGPGQARDSPAMKTCSSWIRPSKERP